MAKRAGARPGPALSARATRSARPCTRALTARVVPTVTRSAARRRAGPSGPNFSSRAFSRAASAARTEEGRSSWQVGALAPARMPSGPQSTASVCVPPASIPRNVCAVMLPPQASLPEMFVCWVVNFRPATDKQGPAPALAAGVPSVDLTTRKRTQRLTGSARNARGRRPAGRVRREAHGGPSPGPGQALSCAVPSASLLPRTGNTLTGHAALRAGPSPSRCGQRIFLSADACHTRRFPVNFYPSDRPRRARKIRPDQYRGIY